ncbi:MAG: hypothetical protein K1X72_09130 [Pyrinomonadaceae bacterium]|nr:hypothetical protein [Pyrinomonadaceae bacterium]
MEEKYLEIKLLKGIGQIEFGMNPSQVISIMDEEQVYENWMGGNLNSSLLFQGMILDFDQHNSNGPIKDSKFCGIKINSRKDIYLFGRKLIEWNEFEFVEVLHANKIQFEQPPNKSIVSKELEFEIYFDKEDDSVWLEFWSFE